MTDTQGLAAALDDVRVLALPGRSADFCAYVLGHLGASVTKVRDTQDAPAPAFTIAYDRGANVLELDLSDEAAAERITDLVRAADIVVTDAALRPAAVDAVRIREINPTVIHAEITTYGATGPYAGRSGGDLIANAASGFLYLTGDPGAQPVRMGADQAAKLAGAEAASGSMIALHYRDRTGRGQHVDVAMRDGMVRASVNTIPKVRYEGAVQRRVGDHWGIRERPLKSLWRCTDGWVSFVRRGGVLGGRVNHACIEWMQSAGMDVAGLVDVEWDRVDLGDADDRALIDLLDARFEEFLMTLSTEEAFHEGLRRGMTLAPVRTLDDVLGEEQFVERGYWATKPIGSDSIRVPGFLVKDSGVREGALR